MTEVLAIGTIGTALLALPHAMPLDRVAPHAAARVWLLALVVRALLAVGLVLFLLLLLPATEPFEALTGGPWLSVDPLVHAAVLTPALAMVASLAAFAFVLARVKAATSEYIRSRGLGDGPQGSLVMADPDVYVALTGVGPKRVLVSAGALDALDPAELQASLAHEDAHQHLRHRAWITACGALRSIARLVPGTQTCERGLRLSLERQADEYAVARTRDPLALASAICKVAQARPPRGALALGTSAAALRLGQLTGSERARSTRRIERGVDVVAAALSVAGFALLAALVALVLSQAGGIGPAIACSF